MFEQELLKNIREIRLEQNKSIRDLANKLNLTDSGYSMKERGRRNLTLRELSIICSELGLIIALKKTKK